MPNTVAVYNSSDDSGTDDDDAGSLVDFIAGDDEEVVPAVGPASDNDGISASNIITGKRKRKQTVTYEQQLFASPEYRKMMLEDVPADEMDAALGAGEESADFSDGEGDNEDEEDGEYEYDEEEDGEEEEDSEEEEGDSEGEEGDSEDEEEDA